MTDINQRLSRLRARRNGTDRFDHITQDAKDFINNKSRTAEAWERRSKDKPSTTYALGAMQPVDADYTRISLETAERVRNQLSTRLQTIGIPTEYRLQGSVPLDVHIRGVSDVDLLTLRTDFFTFDPAGIVSTRGGYNLSSRNSKEVLIELRAHSERQLRLAFPAVNIDSSGGKAIKLTGGSLPRPVDIISSHWFNTTAYQSSNTEHDRAVTIYDKAADITIDNWPFTHIKLVKDLCDTTGGGLRKAIRLCKSVKADIEEDGRKVNLSSFDITACMYHADMQQFRNGVAYELTILAEAQRFLDILWQDKAFARTLRVPDKSRLIFDDEKKFEGLLALSAAMDELLIQVAKENSFLLVLKEKPGHAESRNVLTSIYV
ncbi:hypothetical protein [Pseudomonas sp. S2_E01]